MSAHEAPALSEIVAIEECNQFRANQLLTAGYTLLHVGIVPGSGETFIRHQAIYVIGRLEGAPDFPARLPREERPQQQNEAQP